MQIPARVIELRKMLEQKKFKASKKTYEKFITEHTQLFGNIPSSQKVYIDRALFLKEFNRVIIGAHGPYIEFEESQYLIPLHIKEGQEWRLNTTRYYPRYYWYYPEGFPQIKIYKQISPVKYASYIPGKYYVDVWTVRFENILRVNSPCIDQQTNLNMFICDMTKIRNV
jgi:hypothetical protein